MSIMQLVCFVLFVSALFLMERMRERRIERRIEREWRIERRLRG